jgi:hypothetical protein
MKMKDDWTEASGDLARYVNAYREHSASVPLETVEESLARSVGSAFKAIAVRRVRLKWALAIASLGIVTVALIMELGQRHRTPQVSQSTTPLVDTPFTHRSQALAALADTPSRGLTAPFLAVSKRPLWDTTVTNAKPQYGGAPISLPPARTLTFRVSVLHYGDNTDLDSAVAHDPRHGAEWQVADWRDLEEYSGSHPIQDVIDSLRWHLTTADTEGDYYWLRYKGRSTVPLDEQRHYLTTRFDHNKPSWWRADAQIDNKHIALGSWYGKHFKVLAVKRQNSH